MASLNTHDAPAGRYRMKLSGAPRLFILDADALAEREVPHEGILMKLALLAESEGVQVVIRGVSDGLWQRLKQSEGVRRWGLQWLPAGRGESLHQIMARVGVPPAESLLFLTEAGDMSLEECHVFYVGGGTSPAGAVASRVQGPAGTDALLALYGTALVQEKAGQAFRAVSQGQAIPAAVPFDGRLFEGLVKSYGQEAVRQVSPELTRPAPELDGQMLRALARACFARVLRNVQPNGAIVASPARGEQPGQPNYRFVWQRDAGHALLGLIDWSRRSPFGLDTGPMQEAINSYLGFLMRCQQHDHLGVSRYTVDEQPVVGYGNPQLDGPAISALALMHLMDPRPVYRQIRAYLEYLLSAEGQGPCYDPWEFVYGRILNVLLIKRKAFRAGARLASFLTEEDDSRRYREETARLEAEIQRFIDPKRGYLLSNQEPANPWFTAISGLDVATLGAILSAWDPNDNFFNLTAPEVVGTVMALDAVFAPLYAVNRAWIAAGNAGLGWGRFPEDANDGLNSTGGNPWPLATLWAARYCYQLAERLATAGPFVVTDQRQADYFNQIVGQEIAGVGKQLVKEHVLLVLLPALRGRGDGYLRFVLAHQPLDGSLTEQINRDTGQPQGARDLTWAMVELLNTLMVRG